MSGVRVCGGGWWWADGSTERRADLRGEEVAGRQSSLEGADGLGGLPGSGLTLSGKIRAAEIHRGRTSSRHWFEHFSGI